MLTHDSDDAWLPRPLPAASVEESKVAKLHFLHVFAGGRVAHTVPGLRSSLFAEVVDREFGVVL